MFIREDSPIKLEEENNSQDEEYKEKIKEKLLLMEENQYRTTNFSLIEYFSKNDFKPLIQEELVAKLLKKYNENPSRFVTASDIRSFKSEKNFKNSIYTSISRNKSFIKGPGTGEISLDLKKTYQYLNTIYRSYISNSKYAGTPNKLLKKKNPTNIKRNKNNNFNIINISDMEDEIPKEIPKPKNVKNFNKFSNKKVNIKSNENKSNNKNNINNEIISISSSPSNSNPKVSNIKKESNNVNELFKKMIYFDSFYYINNQEVSITLNKFNSYLKGVKEKNMNNQIEEKLLKIRQYFQTFYDNKISFDEQYQEIKDFHKEISSIYKAMALNLDLVKAEINMRSYNYEIYCQLREIIYKNGDFFSKYINELKKKIEEIKDKEKKLIENRKLTLEEMNFLESNYIDYAYTKLAEEIGKVLNLKNSSLNEKIYIYKSDDKYINNYNSAINIIIKLNMERKKIIDEMDKIDSIVGNVEIF